MWRRVGLVGLGVAVLLLTGGCTAAQQHTVEPPSRSAVSTTPAAQACPVTSPTQGGIPAVVTAQQYTGPVFNTGNLRVGAWWGNPEIFKQASKKITGGVGGDSKYPYGMKYPTWKVQDGKITGAGGKPRISVKPLDGHGQGSGIGGGYTNELMGNGTMAYWWPTVVGFTIPGCWQITEAQGGDSLVYVVKI